MPGWSRIQHVTSNNSNASGTSITVTVSTPVQNNLLIAYCTSGNNGLPSMSSSGWTQQAAASGLGVWAKYAGASESTTVTMTVGSSAGLCAGVMEYSGAVTNSLANTIKVTPTAAVAGTEMLQANFHTGSNILRIRIIGLGSGATAPSSPTWNTPFSTSLDSIQNTSVAAVSTAFVADFMDTNTISANSTTWTNTATGGEGVDLAIYSAYSPAFIKAGALTQVAATTVTPTFGQATTAGNLLIARVATFGTSTRSTTTSTGWVKLVDSQPASTGTPVGTTIYYRPNCGSSEAAPTFTCASATNMYADLLEFSGAATSSPVDLATALNDGAGGASGIPFLQVQSAADIGTSELCIYLGCGANSKTATITFNDSWTPSGGTVVAAQGSGATKQLNHAWFSAYLLSGFGGSVADKNQPTVTPSTGAFSAGAATCSATFKPNPVVTSLVYDDRRIRRNSLLRR